MTDNLDPTDHRTAHRSLRFTPSELADLIYICRPGETLSKAIRRVLRDAVLTAKATGGVR